MPISFFASVLVLVTGLWAGTEGMMKLQDGRALAFSAAGDKTVFSLRSVAGKISRVAVARDETVSKGSSPNSVKVIGEIPGSVVILTDSYSSIPGGMSYCQAGQESFLRVFRVAGRRPSETYRTKLESCRDNIELGSPGLSWSAETRSLSIHWLSAPGEVGKPKSINVKVGADGKAEQTSSGS